MTNNQAQVRIEKLRKEINKYRYQYHVLDNLEISEAALDSLKHELYQLEQQYPEFITPDSPTQRVAGQAAKGFKKATHEVQQWSLEDIFNEEEAKEFNARVKRTLEKEHEVKNAEADYVAELKIDGFHIVLTYKKGLLQTGATRGDGKVGEDVTQNIKTIESIPLRLEEPVDIIVEGEIWMSRKEFERINKERATKGEPLFANPRNCAAGSIRQLDPKLAASRGLDCFVYDVAKFGPAATKLKEPGSQKDELELLKKLGFKVNKEYRHCHNISSAIEFWRSWQNKRDKQPYWIDGVVIKLNNRDWQSRLGYTGKTPRWACAFKFAAEQATTIVEDIFVSVGRMGTLTPIAFLKPVQIAGTTVSRASLHNEDIVAKLDVRKGDTVIIQKAGDIIPEVLQVLYNLRPSGSRKFQMPSKCPVCDGQVTRLPGEAATYCLNPLCHAQQVARLIHYAYGVEIVGLGEKIVEALFNAKLVKMPADFYQLTAEELKKVQRFAQKSAAKLYQAIQDKKSVPLPKFLFGLGIEHIGSETAYLLARSFGRAFKKQSLNPTELLRHATGQELNDWQKIKGIGEKVATSLHDYFQHKETAELFGKFEEAGVQLAIEKTASLKLAGQSFVFTGGLLRLTRDDAKNKVRQLGGDVSESVSSKTSYVVAGDDPGSKYEKAKKLGLRILSEAEFLKLVE